MGKIRAGRADSEKIPIFYKNDMTKKKLVKTEAKEKRDFKAYNVRYSKNECKIIKEKSAESGITETEWIRFSSVDRNPFAVKNVPKINEEAWLETGKLIAAINCNLWENRMNDEYNIYRSLEKLRHEIMLFRNELLNGK
jgi:hypothetical protein